MLVLDKMGARTLFRVSYQENNFKHFLNVRKAKTP